MQEHKLLKGHALSLLGALLFPSLICGNALAQTGTSSVRGSSVDPQGSVVAGAIVTLTSAETNTARTQTTSDGGVYAFELIPAGDYRIEVEAQGFKEALVPDVRALDTAAVRTEAVGDRLPPLPGVM